MRLRRQETAAWASARGSWRCRTPWAAPPCSRSAPWASSGCRRGSTRCSSRAWGCCSPRACRCCCPPRRSRCPTRASRWRRSAPPPRGARSRAPPPSPPPWCWSTWRRRRGSWAPSTGWARRPLPLCAASGRRSAALPGRSPWARTSRATNSSCFPPCPPSLSRRSKCTGRTSGCPASTAADGQPRCRQYRAPCTTTITSYLLNSTFPDPAVPHLQQSTSEVDEMNQSKQRQNPSRSGDATLRVARHPGMQISYPDSYTRCVYLLMIVRLNLSTTCLML
mmetsp:Transcript_7742/g.19888  ORF Transcript_7742/g.19888 Transcript_7742/m.19888 type:complete len:279 (+) Transcript_7742:734-1570(+)